MVQWLRPKVLIGAAREVIVSGLFARFADKRENEAALEASWFDATGLGPPLWLDYASDTGDGFEPTYAVAYLLGRDHLELKGRRLERGKILVLGGDQVYPAAEWDAYQERFETPFKAAFPHSASGDRPWMFALPGNHDWYDGLTSFMREFSAKRSIGAWRTVQSRSYFAIKLTPRWWMWAVDTQFDTYIDHPQVTYFTDAADRLTEGDRVILVTAKPSWVGADQDLTWNTREDSPDRDSVPQAWQTLAFLEERLIVDRGATLELTLTGDLHHYAHYRGTEEQSDRHKITSGGAGAFLSATHTLPPTLRLVDHKQLVGAPGGRRRVWGRECEYPPEQKSKEMARALLERPIFIHTPTFAFMTGLIYLAFGIFGWIAQGSPAIGYSLFGALAALLLVGLTAHAEVARPERLKRVLTKTGLGAVHLAFHLLPLAGLGVVLLAWLDWPAWTLMPAAFLLGLLAGPYLFSVYLLSAHRAPAWRYSTEVFSAQSQSTGRYYKHFLRIRIDSDGGLTIYPIGLRTVPGRARWESDPDGPDSAPWFRLSGGGEPAWELIEGPIEIPAE